eukprot:139968-Prymnesium_polylepis.1
MASALGRKSMLLSLLCQPAAVRDAVLIPPGLRFWGIDSGVKHSVGGSDYGTVRTATFMGRTILRASFAERGGGAGAAADVKLPADAVALQHLVHLTPSLLAEHEAALPDKLSGAQFTQEYGSHGDPITTVATDVEYAVARCTAHPVHENHRVGTFEALLRRMSGGDGTPADPSTAELSLLGELMYQSHASYSTIGLGSSATDLIVQLVRQMGPSPGLYGAKITGGGSGGTVCVLGDASERAEASMRKLLDDYRARSGHAPYVVLGSSVGAL